MRRLSAREIAEEKDEEIMRKQEARESELEAKRRQEYEKRQERER